jgi:prevent-host-death family protein
MPQFSVTQAKAQFSELIQKALLGEEIIVTKAKRPIVKMVVIQSEKRKPGTGKGIWMSPDFDAHLDD